ncbi:MAG: DNA-binding NarL/FixJ family response regulator [Crocinitomicaceae bacterium]|jgi:DNA-binding NarL/FixJ family response regulator
MRILLADDHPIFRKGLKALIQDQFPHCKILEADNGQQAIDLLSQDKFSICILDIDMPEKSGIEVLKHIKKWNIESKPIILTMHNDELFFNEAFDEGAFGFLLKEDSSLEICECLDRASQGVPFVSKKLEHFAKNRKNFTSKLNILKGAVNSLTNAEFNTLTLVSRDKSSKEIAEMLFVTEKSVENYRSRICKKLDLKGGSNSIYKWCVENKSLIARG